MTNPFSDALTGAIAPARVDAFAEMGYIPHPMQQIFHEESRQRPKYLLYGGAASGGKSMALTMDAITNAVNYPGMRIACVRRTYNELDESFIAALSKFDYAQAVGGKWNQTKYNLTFPNGSLINFTYADNEKDTLHFQGGEYQVLYFDESTLFDPLILQRIEERLRSGTRRIPVIGIRYSSNPGGPGHQYFLDKFVIPTETGAHPAETEQGDKIVFIQAKWKDNPHVDKGYERVLDSIADPERRAAMRDGNWYVNLGAFFSQFRKDRHCVPTFDVDPHWQRYCGVDWGYGDPFAAIWAACDNDGRLWVYRERSAPGVDTPTQAQLILEAEQVTGEKSVVHVADPSMWGKHGTLFSVAAVYALTGLALSKADNDRPNGWARLHTYLNDGALCEYHKEQHETLGPDGSPLWKTETCPRLHIFDHECPQMLSTLTMLPRAKKNPDDATTDANDHLPDALRYLVMSVGTMSRPIIYDDDNTGYTPKNIAQMQYEELMEKISPEKPDGLIGGLFAGDLSMSY